MATFEHIKTYDRKTISYDMLHVTPPMGPLDVVKESTLSDSEGWVDVNPTTLHIKATLMYLHLVMLQMYLLQNRRSYS